MAVYLSKMAATMVVPSLMSQARYEIECISLLSFYIYFVTLKYDGPRFSFNTLAKAIVLF